MKRSSIRQCINKFQDIKSNLNKSNGYLLISTWNLRESAKVFFGNDVMDRSLNKKEAYLSKKKQMTELSNEWNPQFQGKYTKKMETCKSSDDIMVALKEIETELGSIPDTVQYVNAIKKAASIKQYSTCFKIFETAKELQRVDLSLYGIMIWVCAQQRSAISLDKGLNLFIEMQEVYSLTPSITIYNQLLALCVKTLEYDKGKYIWKDLRNNYHKNRNQLSLSKNKQDLEFATPNISTYNILIDLYIKCDEIHKSVEIYEGLLNGKYGDLKPNYVIYTTLITGFGKYKKTETTEKLFDKCMKDCYLNTKEHNETNHKQLIILTQCLLDGYANIGNVDKCVDIINNMIDKKHDKYDWTYYPNPNCQMFTCVLKALTRYKMKENKFIHNEIKIDYQTCWTIIEWCLQCMDVLNIKPDAVVYGNLFHLCGDLYGNADLDRALNYYQQMKDNKIKPGELQMFNLLKTGQQYHHHNKSHNEDRKNFVKYILNELQQQEIVPSVQMRKLVTKIVGTVNDH